jgi:hypothetical protein
MGCDGQKHRGPGVFAALLAYSGCMPDHAAAIAYQVWGLNGVPWQTRQAIAEAAAARAQAEPAQSARLRELFSR